MREGGAGEKEIGREGQSVGREGRKSEKGEKMRGKVKEKVDKETVRIERGGGYVYCGRGEPYVMYISLATHP